MAFEVFWPGLSTDGDKDGDMIMEWIRIERKRWIVFARRHYDGQFILSGVFDDRAAAESAHYDFRRQGLRSFILEGFEMFDIKEKKEES